jgi:transcriptional regulator with XRE-family HTH domain
MFQLGSSLREARLRRGLDLADVERATRIRSRYLAALEEERFDVLPGEAYTKGFLRSYAEFLGLDGTLYLDEYNTRFASGEEPSLAPPSRPRGRPTPPIGMAAAAVLGLVVLLVAVAAWRLATPHGNNTAVTTNTTRTTASRPRVHATPPVKKPKRQAPKPEKIPVLVVRATRGPCWILVRMGSGTGQVVTQRTLEAGQHLSFSLRRPLWLRLGAPSNLDVLVGGHLVANVPLQTGNVMATRTGLAAA